MPMISCGSPAIRWPIARVTASNFAASMLQMMKEVVGGITRTPAGASGSFGWRRVVRGRRRRRLPQLQRVLRETRDFFGQLPRDWLRVAERLGDAELRQPRLQRRLPP